MADMAETTNPKPMANWEQIAAKKREALMQSIPSEWIIPDAVKPADDQFNVMDFPRTSGWFTDRELDITGRDAVDILARLRGGKWTSEEVTRAFCKRAAAAHQLVNCLTETLFGRALEDARALDAHLRASGPKGPLHGLPVSLKDNLFVAGTDSTLGFVSLAFQPTATNSPLVDMLRELGAVVYCKTNVPTAMMMAETVNNLQGLTLHPRDRRLTPGGSSGGEAALIAFGASPLGVGSDIGGSLRIPAACTGIFALRPSFGRFPTVDTRSGLPGQEAVQSVNGPMARSLADIIAYCRAVADAGPHLRDPRCLPLPWRREEEARGRKSRLKIGVMWDDGIVRPTPPVARALREVVGKIRSAGHEVVDWAPEGHRQCFQLLGKMFLADGGKSIAKMLEPVNEPYLKWLEWYKTARELGTHEMWQIQTDRTTQCKAYLDRWNACEGLDMLLCPTTPYAAVKHDGFTYVGYTGVFNILDYSALSFPTGINADATVDVHDASKPSLSEFDEPVQGSYNAGLVDGQPISLQLVARRLEEEKLLAMAGSIMNLL